MTFRIEEIPEIRVACMQRTGPYGAGNHALMEKLKAWAAASGLLARPAAIFGVSLDNPETTPPENCRYDACIAVADNYAIRDAAVEEKKLPGGRYAVFAVAHTAQALQQAWGEIFTQLSAAGKEPDATRPVYERYVPAMLEKRLCEICVPV